MVALALVAVGDLLDSVVMHDDLEWDRRDAGVVGADPHREAVVMAPVLVVEFAAEINGGEARARGGWGVGESLDVDTEDFHVAQALRGREGQSAGAGEDPV